MAGVPEVRVCGVPDVSDVPGVRVGCEPGVPGGLDVPDVPGVGVFVRA